MVALGDLASESGLAGESLRLFRFYGHAAVTQLVLTLAVLLLSSPPGPA